MKKLFVFILFAILVFAGCATIRPATTNTNDSAVGYGIYNAHGNLVIQKVSWPSDSTFVSLKKGYKVVLNGFDHLKQPEDYSGIHRFTLLFPKEERWNSVRVYFNESNSSDSLELDWKTFSSSPVPTPRSGRSWLDIMLGRKDKMDMVRYDTISRKGTITIVASERVGFFVASPYNK